MKGQDEPVVYLDHAASTPVRPEAIEALIAQLRDSYANPSGAHREARRARRALDEARDVLAGVTGSQPGDVVFTSGGTEADNLAVYGAVRAEGSTVVCSAIEHHAVLDPVTELGGRTVRVDRHGRLDLDHLSEVLDPSVGLVSVMLVNNEIGVIQDLEAVARVVRREAPDALLHTDAVQAHTWLDLRAATAPADLISLGAHKFGGPKGVGALIVRRGRLRARAVGGGQERDRRSGTQNVAGAVAMAVAASVSDESRDSDVARIAALRDQLALSLTAEIAGVIETGVIETGVTGMGAPGSGTNAGHRDHKVAGNLHLLLPDVESEALLFLLEQGGVMASVASSCSSGAARPSHVLEAIGIDLRAASGALRLSLGWTTTEADVERAAEVIPAAVRRLRSFGGRR